MRRPSPPGRLTPFSAPTPADTHRPTKTRPRSGGDRESDNQIPDSCASPPSNDGQCVGYVDLYDDEAGGRELGYVIGPASRWGRGLGTAAARAGLSFGFEQLKLPSIWAEGPEANAASVRLIQRLGMVEIGGGDMTTYLGESSPCMRFEAHRDEWSAGLKQG